VTRSLEFLSQSTQTTRALGRKLGAVLRVGDVVVLSGELGAGKTTFTQGVAQGMGIEEQVTSPTFVLARQIPCGSMGVPLLHVDAYRISSIHEWDDLDLDVESAATVVEWGQRVSEALPADRLEISLAGQDDRREVAFTASGSRSEQVLNDFADLLAVDSD
jgi:tRNA threonylcarbamoyladenosine biosynthesis protein TsaE